jgi:polyhydroxybutyrate depolymerase
MWQRLNDCAKTPTLSTPYKTVTLSTYAPCRDGVEFRYYSVEGAGHVWVGGQNFLPESVIGKPNNAFKATDLIWDFLKKYSSKP